MHKRGDKAPIRGGETRGGGEGRGGEEEGEQRAKGNDARSGRHEKTSNVEE
jgi:hypothetical protein